MLPKAFGLVDSGCDRSTFPLDWAGPLGIDLKADCIPNQGNTAGGLAEQYIYQPGIDSIVSGKKVHLDAIFSKGLPVILLGREDFFNVFKVSFDQQRKTFSIKSY